MLHQIRKTTKKPPSKCGQKYVKTYSSSNAVAQDSKERVQLINIQYIHYKINSTIQKLQKKRRSSEHDDLRTYNDLNLPRKTYIPVAHPITRENRAVRIIISDWFIQTSENTLCSLFIAYITALTVITGYTKKNATYNETLLHYNTYITLLTIQYLN